MSSIYVVVVNPIVCLLKCLLSLKSGKAAVKITFIMLLEISPEYETLI